MANNGYFHNRTFADLHCMIAQGLCKGQIQRRIATKYHNNIAGLNEKLKLFTMVNNKGGG